MKMNELQKKLHELSIAKGWWDNPVSFADKISLMHTELSEAFEEARSGRFGLYHDEKNNSPSGVYIELIDCVIRILDFLGHEQYREWGDSDINKMNRDNNNNLGETIAWCHYNLSMAFVRYSEGEKTYIVHSHLTRVVMDLIAYIVSQGQNPLSLILIKHEYNKTRPYKHGKKF